MFRENLAILQFNSYWFYFGESRFITTFWTFNIPISASVTGVVKNFINIVPIKFKYASTLRTFTAVNGFTTL